MSRPTAEALLLSALIVNGDVTAASRYGITQHHFRGYPNEFSWVTDYAKLYGEAPSVDAFLDKFPDFPFRQHENIPYAAEEVIRAYSQAKITENINSALHTLRSGDLGAAQEILASYSYTPVSAVPVNLVTGLDFLDEFDAPVPGLPVPWKSLQEATGGISPGNFWVLGARLGQGKSAMLCHIATQTLLAGKRVLYYSLEMSGSELRSRVHAELATHFGYEGITSLGIRRRTVDLYRYKQFVNELGDLLPDGAELNVHTPAEGPVSPALAASRLGEYDLGVIDYLTLMTTDAGAYAAEDWRNATQISNRMKQVALACNTPILAAAQINRDGDIGDNPPKVKNLAQADALGQDADVVVTMRNWDNGAAVLSLEKNRHGPSGMYWYTKFDVNHGVYDEVSQERADSLREDAKMKMGK